jgi:hypothetical protein
LIDLTPHLTSHTTVPPSTADVMHQVPPTCEIRIPANTQNSPIALHKVDFGQVVVTLQAATAIAAIKAEFGLCRIERKTRRIRKILDLLGLQPLPTLMSFTFLPSRKPFPCCLRSRILSHTTSHTTSHRFFSYLEATTA